MAANTKLHRSRGSSLLLLVTLIIAVVLLVPTVQQLVAQRQHIAQLQQAIAQSSEQIATVNAQIDRWKDPAYIRSQARGRLLFVEPGDTTYTVIDDGSLPQFSPEPDISIQLHETRTDPTELLLDSLIRASTPSQETK